ncbi:MAG TPA: PilW family protein [Ideonella sp.]|uniref:PilW family protein n=1 Tax=Ideonella sp. TaxID=1929293 RepID=UPI002B886B8B|nr:PilW family protein [Ideonella sp.]HSI49257.1 PilW family protein [Ideonella sp.]
MNRHVLLTRSLRRGAGGFTLVELMISMVIGLVVMGAVYAAYLASSASTRTSRAVAQMTEDATVAINILRQHIAEGGYSRPVGTSGTVMTRAAGADTAKWLLGCENGFADATQPITTLACNAAGVAGTDVLAVAYEATLQNSLTTKDATNTTVPSDCLGAALTKTTIAPVYFRSYSQFYLQDSQLYCRGPGSATGQPLVENIQEMHLMYGMGGTGADATRVITYKTAKEVSDMGPWSRVLSVRVCLLMRSEDQVLDAPVSYVGCDPHAGRIDPAEGDRHMFRAFTSTIVLHNRMGV